ncbi:30S ribosomal protein S6 [Candidatus Woesebacteria bacterium]|nr:30S ribosomal protein S6 [Candidatus Woesebacteria bacterium]QQG47307.1 MAG: 30S ribosomal protein S6 [Candidatus Woesebacteria bacterium]
MNKYELTVVIDGKATAAKKKSITEKIEKLVKILGGKTGKAEDWGKRDLFYKIKKSETGVFLFFPIEFAGESVKALPQRMKMEDEIIRYLLVKV